MGSRLAVTRAMLREAYHKAGAGAGHYSSKTISRRASRKALEKDAAFKSKAQRAKFHVLMSQGKMSQATIDEWEKATPSNIPERIGLKNKDSKHSKHHWEEYTTLTGMKKPRKKKMKKLAFTQRNIPKILAPKSKVIKTPTPVAPPKIMQPKMPKMGMYFREGFEKVAISKRMMKNLISGNLGQGKTALQGLKDIGQHKYFKAQVAQNVKKIHTKERVARGLSDTLKALKLRGIKNPTIRDAHIASNFTMVTKVLKNRPPSPEVSRLTDSANSRLIKWLEARRAQGR